MAKTKEKPIEARAFVVSGAYPLSRVIEAAATGRGTGTAIVPFRGAHTSAPRKTGRELALDKLRKKLRSNERALTLRTVRAAKKKQERQRAKPLSAADRAALERVMTPREQTAYDRLKIAGQLVAAAIGAAKPVEADEKRQLSADELRLARQHLITAGDQFALEAARKYAARAIKGDGSGKRSR